MLQAIQLIQTEIDRLTQARDILSGGVPAKRRGRPPGSHNGTKQEPVTGAAPTGKRTLSASHLAALAAGRARAAKKKSAGKKGK